MIVLFLKKNNANKFLAKTLIKIRKKNAYTRK